jgi:hypothetical protein
MTNVSDSVVGKMKTHFVFSDFGIEEGSEVLRLEHSFIWC